MMSPERRAMYRVREEATKLGMACAAFTGTPSVALHLAYDRFSELPADQRSLLKRLNGVK